LVSGVFFAFLDDVFGSCFLLGNRLLRESFFSRLQEALRYFFFFVLESFFWADGIFSPFLEELTPLPSDRFSARDARI